MLSEEEKKKYEEIKYNNGYLYCDKEDVDFLIDIIEKQSKEIEELSDKLTEKICKGVEEEILEEYRQTIISKDKEIEELNNSDLTTVYLNGFYDGEKKVKDKIKAKIGIRKDEKEICKDSIEEKYLLREIYVLESLLEKE